MISYWLRKLADELDSQAEQIFTEVGMIMSRDAIRDDLITVRTLRVIVKSIRRVCAE